MAPRKKFGLLLLPGASATAEAPALVTVEAHTPSNVVVRRAEFANPRANQSNLIAAVRQMAADFCAAHRIKPDRLILGGRSMGGRICSIAVAEGLPAAGLVLMSYPLHPPGRPDKLRVDHFPAVTVPTLFVSGTRDPFGTKRKFNRHVKAITGPVAQVWIEGGDHGMKRRDNAVASAVGDWLRELTQ